MDESPIKLYDTIASTRSIYSVPEITDTMVANLVCRLLGLGVV